MIYTAIFGNLGSRGTTLLPTPGALQSLVYGHGCQLALNMDDSVLFDTINRTLTDLLPDKHQYEADYQLYLDNSLPLHPDIPSLEDIPGEESHDAASEDGVLGEDLVVTNEKAADAEFQQAAGKLLEADTESFSVTSPQLRNAPHLTPREAEVIADEKEAYGESPITESPVANGGCLASYEPEWPMPLPRPTAAEAAAEAEPLPQPRLLGGNDSNGVEVDSIPGNQQEPQKATDMPVITNQEDPAEPTQGACQSADTEVQSIIVSQQKSEPAKLRTYNLSCPALSRGAA